MSVDGGHPIRGYRPSQYGFDEAEAEEAERIRSVNVEAYAKRVSAGLPLFEDAVGFSADLLNGQPSLKLR